MNKSNQLKCNRFLQQLRPLQGALEAYCRRTVHRSSEAEDVLQDAVMKAFRDFGRYAEGTNFRAWIFKYVNLEIMAGNRTVARYSHEILAFEPLAAKGSLTALERISPEKLPDAPEIVLDECESELANAIWELSLTEHSVLLLHAIGRFRYREIADILELPIGTVMSHLSRGRQHVRRRFAELSPNEHGGRQLATRDCPRSGGRAAQ